MILGGIIGFVIIWLIVVLIKGMGEGDIEIVIVCGLFLGMKGIMFGLFLLIVLGGVVGIIILCLKLKKVKERIVFGLCIVIGSLIVMIW